MVGYHDVVVEVEPRYTLRVRFELENRSAGDWLRSEQVALGSQIFDPQTALFLTEGPWLALARDLPPGARFPVEICIELPPPPGPYRVYISPRDSRRGWFYLHQAPLLVIDVTVTHENAIVERLVQTSLRRMRWQNFPFALRQLLVSPFVELWRAKSLIASMVRRDLLARYRGSFGDALWAVFHPLLLMATYFFVFGLVLQTRFGANPSRTGYALYFLAGMLPWLQFSEPAARATVVVLEHRIFVKKVVFPVSILPVNLALTGLVTNLLATLLFLLALGVLQSGVPSTVLALPLLLVPQILFTLGVCWFLAATSVYLRDLAQMIGPLLTLWFFVTPICYPETSLPAELAPVLLKNPMFQLVRGYRQILLEGRLPEASSMIKLWMVAILTFFAGYAWFTRLKKHFPDLV
ncbi:MAG: ABC transporter permease [Bryobacteraceae bacterium]|nr:ABC transporter permease [Bryobacteraceae bacterium]MDW8378662.1 ABC transporter permease [Bryobacterales bacterium]